MSTAKESMGSVETCAFKGNLLGDLSSYYGMDEHQKVVFDEGDGSEKNVGFVKNISMSNSSSPSSTNSNGYAFRAENYHHQPAAATEEVLSLINFKSGYDHTHANASCLLSFEQSDEIISQNNTINYLNSGNHKDNYYSMWEGNHLNHSNQWNQINPKYNSDPRLMDDFSCFDSAINYGFMINNNTAKENHVDWIYSEATAVTDSLLESGSQDTGSLKRTNKSMLALKKQLTTTSSKKPNKLKTVQSSKDNQNIASKHRRERISERLKILQELVPNGSKVDLVTMLEKAISYVKFLQLQVKVLATDELWPVQGGKAPEISQVREAIDAILSSQRDRNPSSKQCID